MARLFHIMVLCLVFASMWLHGGVGFAKEDMSEMDMSSMGSSCLQHCLSAVHVDEADNGLVIAPISMSEFEYWGQVVNGEFSWSPSVNSHHDPSRILTTIKRE